MGAKNKPSNYTSEKDSHIKELITIIIPVYNEEKTIVKILQKIKGIKYSYDLEIIVVDDASTDDTPMLLQKVNNIRILKNSINRGKGYSLRKGISYAKGNIILIQDADLEYNPKDHLRLLEVLKTNSVVYGSRFLKRSHKPRYTLFYIGNVFLSFVTKILFFKNISDMETCYKAFRKEIIKDIKLTEDRFGFEPEITCKLLKKGFKIVEVPISYKSRSYEEGKKITVKDGLWALFLLFKFRFSK